MKKSLSLLIALVMLMLSFSVSADSVVSDNMQKALIAVKKLVDVSPELSEFSSYVSENEDKTSYSFEWRSEDYSKSMSVSCDEDGRISSYSNYSVDSTEKKIGKISKREIIDFATDFVKKTLPDAFKNDNDVLVYDENTYSAYGNLRYSLEFKRCRNSIPVKDNYANLSLVIKDDKIYVRNMSVYYDYDAQFEDEGSTIENFDEKYKEKFPVEMVYCDEYDYKKQTPGESVRKSVLIYRLKDNNAGYISLRDGEIITEDSKYELFREENAVMDSVTSAGGASNKEMLTEQEIAELSRIDGLMSVEKIEKSLKALPYMGFTSSMKLTYSNLSKNDDGEYFYRLNYRDEKDENYRYLNAVVNAKDSTLISLNNNSSYHKESDAPLTQKQKKAAEEKMLSFLNKTAAQKLSECEKITSESYKNSVSDFYVRLVNGIKYIDNGINISFDAENNIVTSYRIDFYETDFADTENAIGEREAYEKITQYSPVTPMYILSGGKYVKAATLEKYGVTIDALSGKIRNINNNDTNYTYSDIAGHWVEEAANKLAEIQIGFAGNTLKADSTITQEEFFRFILSGMINKYYSGFTTEELYELLVADKILTEEEKSPQSLITRENAFVYMVRIAGYEKVAKLSDIYKVSYTDGNMLKPENVGYAAILSGMGIICGNQGELRPIDNMTRAETVMMLYKYLLSL